MQTSPLHFGKVIGYRTNCSEKGNAMVKAIDNEDKYAIVSWLPTFIPTPKGDIRGFWVRGITGPEARDLFIKMGVKLSPTDTREQVRGKVYGRVRELAGNKGDDTAEYLEVLQQVVAGAYIYHMNTGNPVEDRGIDIVG